MQLSTDMTRVLAGFTKEYGSEKGSSKFNQWKEKHKLDASRPIPKELKKITQETEGFTFLGKIPLTIQESGAETDGRKWCVIGGTALTVGKSRNGIVYAEKNIKENDGKESRFFVEHNATVDNVVGKVSFMENDGKLDYRARIRNTAKHPDIVEKAMDGLFEVSIEGRYKDLVPQDDGSMSVEGLDIRALVATGVGGVVGNTVDYAIAESYSGIAEEDIKNYLTEVEGMVEAAISDENVLKENEQLRKELEEHKKQLMAIKEAEKASLVKGILELNAKRSGTLKEEELMKLDSGALKILKEQEESIKVPVVKESAVPEGTAQLSDEDEGEEEGTVSESDLMRNIVVEKDGTTYLKESAWRQYNRNMRGEVRNWFSSMPKNPNDGKYGR